MDERLITRKNRAQLDEMSVLKECVHLRLHAGAVYELMALNHFFGEYGYMAELMEMLDGPRTAQQELFYDLEDATAIIAWSVNELATIAGGAKSPDEAVALMKMGALLAAQQEKLSGYADEVKAGRIVRGEDQ